MKNTIRGSDVFVQEDLRSMFAALAIVARHQPAGEFRAGFLAAIDAMRTAVGIHPASPLDDWRVVEEPQIVEVRR